MSTKIRIYNKNTRQAESFDPDTALRNLLLEDRYVPLDEEDYVLKTPDGQFMVVKGKDLYRQKGDINGTLVTQQDYATDVAVTENYSQTGQFLRSALSEAVLLGLNKNQALPDDPLTRQIELKRRELFGTSETAGSIFGSLAPLVVGGVGGLMVKAGKKGAGAVLKQAGKAPSALVFKGADEAGKLTQKGFAKMGLTGAKSQATARVLGTSVGLGAIEGGIAGIKQGKQVYREKQYTETENTMKSVLGQGFAKAGEVFTSTAGIVAGLSGAGFALTQVGKYTGKGVKKVMEETPMFFRNRFFGTEFGVRGQHQLEKLRKSFKTKFPKRTKEEHKALLEKADNFLRDNGLVDSTRDKVLVRIKNNLSTLGETIDKNRFEFWNLLKLHQTKDSIKKVDNVILTLLNKEANDLIKGVGKVQGATTHKPFVNTMLKIKAIIRGHYYEDAPKLAPEYLSKPFIPQTLNEIMKSLSKYAKYLKRERSELAIDKSYREAYARFSLIEDQLFKSIPQSKYYKTDIIPLSKGIKTDIGKLKETIAKNADKLKEQKDLYSQLKTVEDVIQTAMPPGSNFMRGFANFRDIAILGGFGYSFGPPGIIAGAAVSIGIQQAHQKGYKYLQMARIAEDVQSTISKVNNKKGVKELLLAKEYVNDTHQEIGIKGLSFLFFGRIYNNNREFYDTLIATPEYEKRVKGQDDLYQMADDFGGRASAQNFVHSMMRLKQNILNILPLPTINNEGKRVLDNNEMNKFFNTINQGVTPFGFLKAVQNKSLTQSGYDMAKQTFPNFVSDFNTNFLIGYKDGTIDEELGRYYKNFLDNQNTIAEDFIFDMLGAQIKAQAPQPQPGQRKFRKQESTISESVAGGY